MVILPLEATMTVDKSKFGIINEGSREYILVSKVPEYAKEHFSTSFSIPSYRTIRYYVSEGIIDRPLKRGRETFFELEYILSVIELLRELQKWYPSIAEMRELVLNAKKYNEFGEVTERLQAADNNWLIKTEARGKLMNSLATKRPSTVKVSDIEKNLFNKTKKAKEIPW
jgi:DNA-binding transcriptional MerR regulator